METIENLPLNYKITKPGAMPPVLCIKVLIINSQIPNSFPFPWRELPCLTIAGQVLLLENDQRTVVPGPGYLSYSAVV